MPEDFKVTIACHAFSKVSALVHLLCKNALYRELLRMRPRSGFGGEQLQQ
jgi:hypothetical protein